MEHVHSILCVKQLMHTFDIHMKVLKGKFWNGNVFYCYGVNNIKAAQYLLLYCYRVEQFIKHFAMLLWNTFV